MAKKKSAAPEIPSSRAAKAPAAPHRRFSPGAASQRMPQDRSVRPGPSHEEIAEAAYHRYLSRGGHQGSDFDDWVEAERELRSRRSP